MKIKLHNSVLPFNQKDFSEWNKFTKNLFFSTRTTSVIRFQLGFGVLFQSKSSGLGISSGKMRFTTGKFIWMNTNHFSTWIEEYS